ncbi:MAG: hypothetical protein J0I19_08280 [Alphaproteobacteria bacterium]|nr:hypothetical protein [Alphaproteobacteria bacterium]
MTQYQLYFLSDEDRDIARHDYCCSDDRAAIVMGRTLCQDNSIDIWQNGRRVARVSVGDFGLRLRMPPTHAGSLFSD